MTAPGIVAIVPMKPLILAKTRLSEELTQPARMALSRSLLRRVLRAISGPFPGLPGNSAVESAWVVGGDSDVRRVAGEEGALWLEEAGPDINGTLRHAFQRAFDLGKAALFLPGDLPFVKSRDIDGMARASGHLRNITLSPARQGGGTNGILVPPDLPQPFYPLLGPDSFRNHLAQAASSGISVAIFYSPGLGFDLDTFEDLRAYEYMEPGLLDKLTQGEQG